MRISRLNLICIICAVLMCLFLCACGDNAPPSKPKDDTPSLNIGNRGAAAQNANTGNNGDTAAETEPDDANDIEGFEVEEDKLYSGANKTDPFLPLIKADATGTEGDEDEDGKRRIPQTPLERFDLGQLKLSAVVETAGGNSAVIVESSGRGYVVKPGAYVGLNGGQITEIKSDRVIIEEPMGKNERGEIKVNIVELILPKPAGAF